MPNTNSAGPTQIPLIHPIEPLSASALAPYLRAARACASGPAIWAIVPAAGSGSRAGPGGPKQYRPWHGEPVLAHSLRTLGGLAGRPDYAATLAVLSSDDQGWASAAMQPVRSEAGAHPLRLLGAVIGGESRRDSVLNALEAIWAALGRSAEEDWILVHDAARPGLSATALNRLVETCLAAGEGGLLALPIPDTIKRARPGSAASGLAQVAETLSREGLWAAQTPQMFRLGPLLSALRTHPGATDESSAMEAMGVSPLLVLGERENGKLTFAHDFPNTQTP